MRCVNPAVAAATHQPNATPRHSSHARVSLLARAMHTWRPRPSSAPQAALVPVHAQMAQSAPNHKK